MCTSGSHLTNERQARALKEVPESEREEVLKRAAETGAVTAKSITEAAKEHAATNGTAKQEKPAKEEKPPARLDRTGYEIPEKILADWDRATETAKRNMSALSDIRVELKHAIDEQDVVYAEVSNTSVADLTNAYTTFKLVLPYAVCTTCGGHGRARCSLCKRRGFLSDFAYRMYVPAEVKKIREKATARRK